jgi:ADP-ribose pyrophosphatase
MQSWKRIEPTTVHKIGHRTIVSKTFLQPDGGVVEYEVMGSDSQEYAAVLALTEDKKVIIARHFRAGPECIMDELPGGGIEADETPENAAKRELREETGYEVGQIEYIGHLAKDAYMNGMFHFFWATECKLTSKQQLDENELIDVGLISPSQLIDNAMNGRMTEQALVLLAYERLKKLA